MKLPLNCKVDYLPDFINQEEANELYRILIDVYKIDKARLMINAGGKLHKTDSFKIIFLTTKLLKNNSYPEHIHGKSYEWAGIINELRAKIIQVTGIEFEVGMCLYYPNGEFFAPYHSDQETSGSKTVLPSLSLGEKREFCYRENNSGDIYSLDLDHGSLIVMGENCQSKYQHSLPKNTKYQNGRINITFRERAFK
jgi:alkylated DNA repair dioxygenase AlkB